MQFLAVRWTPRLRLPTQTQFYTASPMAVPAIHKTQISAGGAWAAAWDTNTLNFVVLGTERMVGRMQGSDLAELMQRGGRADGHTQIHVALKAGQTMRAWSTWWPTFHIGLQIINSHKAISSGTYMVATRDPQSRAQGPVAPNQS